MSDVTKKYKRIFNTYSILSFTASVAPVAFFLVKSILNDEIETSKKVALGFTLIVSIVLVALNTIRKYKLSSPIYILLIGLAYCMRNLTTLFIVMAICTMLNEFIFTPLKRKYKEKLVINKELDARES